MDTGEARAQVLAERAEILSLLRAALAMAWRACQDLPDSGC